MGNFYAPVKTLLDGAVAAGFIKEENLALVQIIDLPGGKAANFEEAKADEWGPAAVKALQEWSAPVRHTSVSIASGPADSRTGRQWLTSTNRAAPATD